MEVGAFPEGTGERCGVTVFGRGYAAVDILRNEDHTLTARYLECFNAKKGAAEEVLCSFALRFDGDRDAAWQETGTRPFPAQAGEWVGAKIGTYRVR